MLLDSFRDTRADRITLSSFINVSLNWSQTRQKAGTNRDLSGRWYQDIRRRDGCSVVDLDNRSDSCLVDVSDPWISNGSKWPNADSKSQSGQEQSETDA